MATNYPSGLDTTTNLPTAADLANDDLDTKPHSTLHGDLGLAVLALETKVGIDSSADTTSVDYKLAHSFDAAGAAAAAQAASQPLDSDLTAIAALSTTSFGRGLLAAANAAALGITASDVGAQPLDSDLTAIAALTTTSYGRALLTLADTAALLAAVGAIPPSQVTGVAAVKTDNLSVFASTTSAQLAGIISNETGSGALVFATSPTLTTAVAAADPTTSLGLATKQYVDNLITSQDSKPDVDYCSTSALPANTYANGSSGVGATLTGNSNGPLVIDGVTILVGMVGRRVLVAGEAASANNGWYTITQQGVVAISPYILTRATESDQAAEIGPGYLTSVKAPSGVSAGSANDGKVFLSIAPVPFVVGTSAVTFSSVGNTYSAGTGLGLSGTTFSIDTATTVDKTTAQTLTNKTLTAPVLSSPTGLAAADIPSLDAAKITTGTMATARLGSGSASSSTFLRGDQTYATPVVTTDPTLAILQRQQFK